MRHSIDLRFNIFLILLIILWGCQNPTYYAQAIAGQIRIMSAKRPISELMGDPSTPLALKEKLTYVLALREFARTELRLPVGAAYSGYADIRRPFVAWNVFAAPEFSLEPKTWCYPLIGCASYRGYFNREEAENFSNSLRKDGYDVFVSGVLAYSTLGWFDDPALSSFLGLDNIRLSALIFHELAHRVLYVAGDTEFNESFATAIEAEGIHRWAAASQKAEIFEEHQKRQKLRDKAIERISRLRNELNSVYASHLSPEQKKIKKKAAFSSLLRDLESEKQRHPEMASYAEWFASGPNNAAIVPFAAYHDLVPAFQRLLNRFNGDLEAFYLECRRLSCLTYNERKEFLHQVMSRP